MMDWIILIIWLAMIIFVSFPQIPRALVQRMDRKMINESVNTDLLITVSVFELLHGKNKLSSELGKRIFHQVGADILFINGIYRRANGRFLLLTPYGEIDVDGKYLVLAEG